MLDKSKRFTNNSALHISGYFYGSDAVHNHILFFFEPTKHKKKPDGARCRAKRTIAKEKLYLHIYQRISKIYPRLNAGVSTSIRGDITNGIGFWRQI
jgi:hypothetical protein